MKNTNKHKILAVNDNPEQLELLALILKQAGFQAVTAMSGNEGFEAAVRELPDLIISDVLMSDGDGIDLCRLIRADERLSLLPILLLSALRKGTDSVLEGLEAGADDYIEAPYAAETLIAKATRLIERKLMADAVRESENRLQTIFDNAAIGMALVDSEWRAIQSNQALQRMLGYSGEELRETSFNEFTYPEDISKTVPLSQEVIDGKRDFYRVEKRYVKKSGEIMWANLTVSSIRKNAGGLPYVIGMIEDITERKFAENALRESEESYRILAQTASDAIIKIDNDSRILFINRAGEEIFGYRLEELHGRPLTMLMPESTRAAHSAGIRHYLETGKQNVHWNSLEVTALHRDGHEFPLELSFGEHRSGKHFFIGVARDITERKQAETALAEANDRAIREYVRLLERLAAFGQKLGTARDLTAVFSAILEFALASVPCAALFISLYDKEKRVRKSVYIWQNGDETDVSMNEPGAVGNGPTGQAITSGEVVIVEDFRKTFGKKTTHLDQGAEEDAREPRSSIIAPMKIMGSVVGDIEIRSCDLASYTEEHATALRMAANLAAHSIENVRLLEQERENAEQLRQAQKLESVGRLAGGIAHDFNNMLTIINGYSELILEQIDSDSPLRSKIVEIKKAGERSAALTDQLLAFSRRKMLKTKVLDINEIIVETSKMLQRLIGEDIQLNILPGSEIGQIEADPGQLTQVVMNLTVNARDSMPQGGELTVETANVYLSEEFAARHVPTRAGQYVLLSVKDTGTGIDEESRQHIFEPFYTTKEVGKGTGLGLATVYGIVKQAGGYIWVESEIGKGTTFKIYLPRIVEKVDLYDEEPDAAEEVRNGNETILLVEDEAIVRNLISQILKSCGYKVIESGNGIEALSICRQAECEIDLLITDIVMPKMSGRQLGEQLALLRPEIEVLYMSGYTDDTRVRRNAAEMCANFIQKPFTFKTLAEKVRELLDAKNRIRQIN